MFFNAKQLSLHEITHPHMENLFEKVPESIKLKNNRSKNYRQRTRHVLEIINQEAIYEMPQ